jgi:hypothetical protein
MNTVKSLNSHKISLRSTGDIEKSTKLNQKEDSKFFQAEKEEQSELNSIFPDEIALHIMRKVKDLCTISSLSLTSKATYNILKSPEIIEGQKQIISENLDKLSENLTKLLDPKAREVAINYLRRTELELDNQKHVIICLFLMRLEDPASFDDKYEIITKNKRFKNDKLVPAPGSEDSTSLNLASLVLSKKDVNFILKYDEEEVYFWAKKNGIKGHLNEECPVWKFREVLVSINFLKTKGEATPINFCSLY